MKLFLVKEEDVKEIDGILVKNILTFNGTMKVRQVLWKSPKKELEMRRLSCFIYGTKKCYPLFHWNFQSNYNRTTGNY